MSLPDPIALERLRYRQGQQLRSRDRRDQVAIEAQLRAWHNRAMHNAYGVVEGLTVELHAHSATVYPGRGYDARGRELILQQPRAVPFPTGEAKGEIWLLLALYKETAECPKRSDLAGVCFDERETPFLETLECLWQPEKSWVVQDGVPLARVTIAGARVTRDEEFVKPRVRALAKARIVTGSTLAGATIWEPWTTETMPGVPIGFQVTIDTSHAGFTSTPCYFAWLQGALWDPRQQEFIAAPFQHIADASFQGFTLRLWLPQLVIGTSGKDMQVVNNNIEEGFPSFVSKKHPYVSWIGIQEGPESDFNTLPRRRGA